MGGEDIGLDEIMERLRRAVAGGAHPRRNKMGSSPISDFEQKEKPHQMVWFLFGGRYRTRTYDLTHCKRSTA